MFDTHCHLNFSAFKKNVDQVITEAHEAGISHIMIPGTDLKSSEKAIEIAQKNDNIYASVGIHPHHIFEMLNVILGSEATPESNKADSGLRTSFVARMTENKIKVLEKLLSNKKVVAIGEVGVDRHYYTSTKYKDYKIDESFIDLQKKLLKSQIKLAIKYDKSLILHNREAKGDLFSVLDEVWDDKLRGRTVLHCCEPDFAKASSGKPDSFLDFAIKHNIYIGVDGDITYRKDKQEFVKKIPLNMLVLETDSPFLLPEPLRTQKKYPNVPKNIKLIAEFIAEIIGISINKLVESTTKNSFKLFNLNADTT